MRSRSPKSKQLFVSHCYIHANLVKVCQPVHEISFRKETVNLTVTLKIRSRSPKSNQLLILLQWYRHGNLVTFQAMIYEITCRQALFGLNLAVLSLAVTLKIRSKSPKLISSSSCPNANLVKFQRPVHEICRLIESMMVSRPRQGNLGQVRGFAEHETNNCCADADGIHTKNMSPFLSEGNIIKLSSMLSGEAGN